MGFSDDQFTDILQTVKQQGTVSSEAEHEFFRLIDFDFVSFPNIL